MGKRCQEQPRMNMPQLSMHSRVARQSWAGQERWQRQRQQWLSRAPPAGAPGRHARAPRDQRQTSPCGAGQTRRSCRWAGQWDRGKRCIVGEGMGHLRHATTVGGEK